jgi:uncharacterized protein (DUF849 family)
MPTPDPAVFMQFLPRIKQSCDAVINITTGGSLGMSMEDRLVAPLRAKLELCLLNMGSMNFGRDWKYDWETSTQNQDDTVGVVARDSLGE